MVRIRCVIVIYLQTVYNKQCWGVVSRSNSSALRWEHLAKFLDLESKVRQQNKPARNEQKTRRGREKRTSRRCRWSRGQQFGDREFLTRPRLLLVDKYLMRISDWPRNSASRAKCRPDQQENTIGSSKHLITLCRPQQLYYTPYHGTPSAVSSNTTVGKVDQCVKWKS